MFTFICKRILFLNKPKLYSNKKLASKRALGYQLTPHELRHSSATFYIQKFGAENVGGFYYRYGWKFGSDVAGGYIKQHLFGGEIGQEKVVKVVESDRVEQLESQVEKLKKELLEMPQMIMAKFLENLKNLH